MTSTEIFSGVQNERPTSRVLKPPGGGSSDIFGGDPAPSHAAGLSSTAPGDHSHGNQPKNKNNPMQDSGPSRVGNAIAAKAFAAQNAGTGVASLFGGGYDPPKPAPARMAPVAVQQQQQQQQEAPPAPAPAPVVVAQPEAPPPSPQQQQQQQQQQPEPPVAVAPAQPAAPAPPAPAATPAFVRVRQPPGGRSSNIFG